MTNTPTPTMTPIAGQPAPTSPPNFSGRDIGVTYFAISGLRDTLLADVGMTFEDSLLLNALAGRGGSATRDELAAVLIAGLKISPDAAAAQVDGVIARALAADAGAAVTATPLGIETHDRFTERVAQNAPKLYGGIPDEDLATTRRVLQIVTERANRELELISPR